MSSRVRHRDEPERLPSISVVMPVRNEAAAIADCLRSVLQQDYPSENLEVLLIDGCSTDATRQLALETARQSPAVRFRIVDNEQRRAAPALNIGFREARGELVARVDGHCTLPPDYLRRAVAHLDDASVTGVGGTCETIGSGRVPGAIALAMSTSFGVGNSGFRTLGSDTPPLPADTVPFPIYRRSVARLIGGYDEELVRNQDDEYNYRIRHAGGRLLLAGDLATRYFSRTTFRALFRQMFQYGFWKVRVLQKHPRQMMPRQFVPALFVASLLLASALTVIAVASAGVSSETGVLRFAPLTLTAVATLYAVANLSASLVTARRHGWGNLLLLPVAYFVMHAGYGLGSLVGLVRFIGRWGDRRGLTPEIELSSREWEHA